MNQDKTTNDQAYMIMHIFPDLYDGYYQFL